MASGGYAEQALAAVERLHEVPDGMPCAVAVASIGTGRTAVGIRHPPPVEADDIVVVTSAAGGLGVLLIQAAKQAGATVVGLAGGDEKVAIARAQGADVAVDYRIDGWDDIVRRELGGDRVTLVFDGVGGKTGNAAYDLLGPGRGGWMQYGWFTDEPATYDDPASDREDAARAADAGPARWPAFARGRGARPRGRRQPRAARRRCLPAVGTPPGFDRALEGRQTYGKVVLVPDALRVTALATSERLWLGPYGRVVAGIFSLASLSPSSRSPL